MNTKVPHPPIAIVTGGVRGIGRAIAETLIAMDYQVIVTYCNSHAQAQQMQTLFKNMVDIRRTDISKKEDVDALFDEVLDIYDRVDVLINNAGITQDKTFHNMDANEWHEVIDVNLNGTFYCCNRAIPVMREQGSGRIINISSVVGQKGNFGQANYAASKAGLLGLTKTLALENAMKGITVNAVCPGFIETDMVSVIPETLKQKIQEQIPMKRFGTAQDVAGMVEFLVSQKAAYITGQEFNVNGGLMTH